MIAFLEGVIEEIGTASVVLNVNGVGYEIFVTDLKPYALQQTCRFYTYAVYREDNQLLYGFSSCEQRNFFKLLVEKVNGVGPKLALTLLSFFPLSDLFSILFNQDDESLSKCPGVGKKTAQRLVLELHDYLKKLPVIKTDTSKKSIGLCKDAAEALIILGYQRKTAEELIAKVYAAEPQLDSVESLLKKAFQYAIKKTI